jgi:hypothetical protein
MVFVSQPRPSDRNAVLLPKLRSLKMYDKMMENIVPLLAPAPSLRKEKFVCSN